MTGNAPARITASTEANAVPHEPPQGQTDGDRPSSRPPHVPKDNELRFTALGNPVLVAETTLQFCFWRNPPGLGGSGERVVIPHDKSA